MSFADAVARRAEADPDGELVRLAGAPGWSASVLWQRALAIAGGLARFVAAGDAVATRLPAGPETIAVTTALSVLGAVELPLSDGIDERWARRLARAAGCVLTVTTGDALRRAPFLGELGRHPAVPVVTLDADHQAVTPIPGRPSRHPVAPVVTLDANHQAATLFPGEPGRHPAIPMVTLDANHQAATLFPGEPGRHPATPVVTLGAAGFGGAGRARAPYPGMISLGELIATGRPVSPRRRGPGDPCLIMTTSGTTGRVKGALLPVAAGPGQAARVQRAMRYDATDVLYNCFPWQHINARHAAFLPAVVSGARLVIDSRFSASRFVEVMRAEEVTAFNFMGAVCALLLRRPPSAGDREHRVRRAYGGPAPAAMVAAMRERFGVTLLQAYACTELGDVATTAVGELRPGAAGRPVPEYDLRVVDALGSDVPAGQSGELLVRPALPHLAFLEYAGDAEATARAWHDGWFRTGDRARLDAGWLYFEGRTGDVIRRRGVNISPDAIEEVIATMPGVAEVAVVAVPSELTEDEVLAVVVPAGTGVLDPADVRKHCAGRLPRHALPRFVSMRESLPRNANLKVSRADVRREGLPPDAWDSESTLEAR